LDETDKPSDRSSAVSGLSQRFRQLGDVHRNPSRLIPREQFRRRSPPRLILEVAVSERLSVVVDDKTGAPLPHLRGL
jgi:hypothetical protein